MSVSGYPRFTYGEAAVEPCIRDDDGLQVRDPDDDRVQQPKEALQVGPSRPSLLQKVPPKWRRPAVTFVAFVSGVAAGGGALLWWQDGPAAPPPLPADEHAVELLLFDVVRSRPPPDGRTSEDSPLQVDSAVFLSGAVTSTVLRIEYPDDSLDVRIPNLPVTVSSDRRIQSVTLEIIVRDCEAATRWKPIDRPFLISWRDDDGKVHTDGAGDFDRSMAASLIRYVEAVCPPTQRG